MIAGWSAGARLEKERRGEKAKRDRWKEEETAACVCPSISLLTVRMAWGVRRGASVGRGTRLAAGGSGGDGVGAGAGCAFSRAVGARVEQLL
jgi:hypothetical protein